MDRPKEERGCDETRFDRLAGSFMAVVRLGFIQRYRGFLVRQTEPSRARACRTAAVAARSRRAEARGTLQGMQTLEQRIRALERSNRRLRGVTSAATLCCVAVVALGAVRGADNAAFDELTCRAIRVVDKDGKVRVTVGALSDRAFGMTILDADSKPRIGIGTTLGGDAMLDMLDAKGESRMSIETDKEGYALTRWKDARGNPRVVAGTYRSAEEAPSLPTADLKQDRPEPAAPDRKP